MPSNREIAELVSDMTPTLLHSLMLVPDVPNIPTLEGILNHLQTGEAPVDTLHGNPIPKDAFENGVKVLKVLCAAAEVVCPLVKDL